MFLLQYRSEGPSQVFFILVTWLLALLQTHSVDTKKYYLAYDNMCNLCNLQVARKPLPLPPPFDKVWLNMNKIIDTFHLRNHTNPLCHTTYSPRPLKEAHPSFNTQAGEQTSHGWDDLNTLCVPWQRLIISFTCIEWLEDVICTLQSVINMEESQYFLNLVIVPSSDTCSFPFVQSCS